MKTHDSNRDPASEPRRRIPVQAEARETLVARTLETGDTKALDPGSVLHMQRTTGNTSVVQLLDENEEGPDVVPREGGQPLEPAVRRSMERSFGQDFGGVRVHTDGRSGDAAASVNAIAYTLGDDIVFERGRYNPSSPEGKHTLAHELTHVVQQRSGPVEGSAGPGGVRVSDPSDRFERAAAATADTVIGRIQRQTPEEEDEPLQSLQRAPGDASEELEEEANENAVGGAAAGGTASAGAAASAPAPEEVEDEEKNQALQGLQRETPEEEEERLQG